MTAGGQEGLVRAPAVRGVSFDVTGTLIHAPALGAIYSEVLARHGVVVEAARLAALVRLVWSEIDCATVPTRDRFSFHPGGGRAFWRRFVSRLCLHLEVPLPRFAAAELYERFARREAWEVFPEVPEVLATLRRRGLRLAVVSNWDERLPLVLERLDLAPYFTAIVYSAAVGVEKPHPAIFASAVEALGLAAGQVVHVGDRRRIDVEGAQGAGLRALALGRCGGGDLASLAELPGLLHRA